MTPETFQEIYKDFSMIYDPDAKAYRVAKKVNGRVMITNYDPEELSNEERYHLHEEAELVPYNDILIDIRAGHAGGDMPLHGRMRLRSFHEILTFIGRGLEEEPEYDVAPDRRSPPIRENPAHTLEVAEDRHKPPGDQLYVEMNGRYYFVRPQPGYQWNRKVFSLLYQLFQMSVSTVVQTGPAITIAK